MERIPLPEKLDLSSNNKSKSWQMFQQTWNNYEIAADLQDASAEKRTAILLSVIGKDALQVYNTFRWQNLEDARNATVILQKFADYCVSRIMSHLTDISSTLVNNEKIKP